MFHQLYVCVERDYRRSPRLFCVKLAAWKLLSFVARSGSICQVQWRQRRGLSLGALQSVQEQRHGREGPWCGLGCSACGHCGRKLAKSKELICVKIKWRLPYDSPPRSIEDLEFDAVS